MSHLMHRGEIQELMSRSQQVRNVSVIAHVDHGKTTLTDSLLARAGLINKGQAGDRRLTDTRKDEQERGITIKSTAVTLAYTLPSAESEEGESLLVNLIDSPGHVDFSSEVTAALRVSDGALVVVDAISGVCVQTETVLRQALAERIRPALVINKLDRCILEKQNDPEDLYQGLAKIINDVNVIIQTYTQEGGPLGDLTVSPEKGNVAFASGVQGWGFTIPQMAELYSGKTKTDKQTLTSRLWGEHYYNTEKKKWTTMKQNENSIRGFCKYILEPIYKILHHCNKNEREEAVALADKLGLTVPREEVESNTARGLTRFIMSQWLPAADSLLELMHKKLPSPVEAQAYRTELLYEGPLDDEVAVGMKLCDPNAPLMMYVSKMVPSNEKGRFYAFGRVFSGTITAGQKVLIFGPNYNPELKGKSERHEATVPRVATLIAGITKMVDFVPCGSVCAATGIDKYLLKTGTVTTYPDAHNLKVLKFSVSPVVQIAVEACKPQDLPKLVEGLNRLAKSDPMVQINMDSGQHIVAGAGELHLEICLKDLEEVYANIPIKKSQPVVTYKETVSATSRIVCLAKSTNKHNRIYMTAQPLEDGIVDDIEKGIIYPTQNYKERARYLADKYDWDVVQARKIWSFGPGGHGPNLLVDCTRGIHNIQDAKDTMIAGFQWAVQEGVLCEENVRGVRYNIVDVLIHNDPACRKGGQIIPATRRAVLAATLTASPRMMEPVFLAQIQVPESHLGSVYTVIHKRRGMILEELQPTSTPMFEIKAHLPVAESFGFPGELRGASSGQAFPHLSFDHYAVVPGDPLEADSKLAQTISEIRARKRLNAEIPPLEHFLDKL